MAEIKSPRIETYITTYLLVGHSSYGNLLVGVVQQCNSTPRRRTSFSSLNYIVVLHLLVDFLLVVHSIGKCSVFLTLLVVQSPPQSCLKNRTLSYTMPPRSTSTSRTSSPPHHPKTTTTQQKPKTFFSKSKVTYCKNTTSFFVP